MSCAPFNCILSLVSLFYRPTSDEEWGLGAVTLCLCSSSMSAAHFGINCSPDCLQMLS